jgi:hypothetical protein
MHSPFSNTLHAQPYPERRHRSASTASSFIATHTPSLFSPSISLPYRLPPPFPHNQSKSPKCLASANSPALACSRLNFSLSSDLHPPRIPDLQSPLPSNSTEVLSHIHFNKTVKAKHPFPSDPAHHFPIRRIRCGISGSSLPPVHPSLHLF